MSPKSLVFLVIVGLCATQMVSAHREARGIADFFNTAKNKLANLLGDAEDSTRSSINAVKGYINNIENKLLEAGTDALTKAGLKVNLTDLAVLVKENVVSCTGTTEVQDEAKAILNNLATCIVKDVNTLVTLKNEMEDLWATAKSMPEAIKNVTAQCKSDDPIPEDPLSLTVTLDTSDHELAAAGNELLESASKHLSRRALFDLSRTIRCAKSVFKFAKEDLVSIPGEIITVATQAYRVTQSVQVGIPACVAKKATENLPALTKLGLEVGSCVAAGVADGDLSTNQSLQSLKNLANAAKALNNVANSDALKAANGIAKLIG